MPLSSARSCSTRLRIWSAIQVDFQPFPPPRHPTTTTVHLFNHTKTATASINSEHPNTEHPTVACTDNYHIPTLPPCCFGARVSCKLRRTSLRHRSALQYRTLLPRQCFSSSRPLTRTEHLRHSARVSCDARPGAFRSGYLATLNDDAGPLPCLRYPAGGRRTHICTREITPTLPPPPPSPLCA